MWKRKGRAPESRERPFQVFHAGAFEIHGSAISQPHIADKSEHGCDQNHMECNDLVLRRTTTMAEPDLIWMMRHSTPAMDRRDLKRSFEKQKLDF